MKFRVLNRILTALLLAATLAAAAGWYIIRRPHRTEIHRSPFTDHSIEVWVHGELFAGPGDSGSGPGYVQLMDGNGKILEKKAVDLVISINAPRWSKDKVEIPLFTEWPLTRR